VAFPGDYVAVGQIDEELIAVTGPNKLFGYLTEQLEAATIDTNALSAGNASVRIMYFNAANQWVDSGLTRTVQNLFEGVIVSSGTLITAEFVYNRWVVTAVGCQATALTFP